MNINSSLELRALGYLAVIGISSSFCGCNFDSATIGSSVGSTNAITANINAACTPSGDPGRVIIHRLNRTEYNNTVHDLWGITSQPANGFLADEFGARFDNQASQFSMNSIVLSQYDSAARSIVSEVWSNNKSQVMSCSTNTPNCVSQIISALAEKAFRRPVSSTELSGLVSFFNSALNIESGNFEAAIQLVFRAILVNPNFLFRMIPQASPNDPTQIISLDPYKLAERLSYGLWMSAPDATLYAAAKNGTLTTPSVLKAQMQRMLKDPKSHVLADVFASEWFGLNALATAAPDPTLFPQFTSSLRQAMLTETTMLVNDVIQNDQSPMTLVNANYTYVNQKLASFYGISGVQGTSFVKVPAPKDRVGLGSHAGILAMNSHPTATSIVKRGQWIMANLLCQPPAPPPPGIPPLPPPASGGTQRQRLVAHVSNPVCASCHGIMDPLGFTLERFDAIGNWRATDDGGLPLDLTGNLPDGTAFNSPTQMMQLIAGGSVYPRCATSVLANFMLGRDLGPSDQCVLSQIATQNVTPNSPFSQLVWALITSDMFTKQRGDNGQ